MKTIKLDRRYNGHGKFQFCIEFKNSERSKFVKIREWCWTTFGPSCELELHYVVEEPNVEWAWEHTEYSTRIFFKTDKELNWYSLRWSSE